MTKDTFIACDPGGSGAIAWSDRTGEYARNMPETRRELVELILQICNESAGGPIHFYIEKVAAYIPDSGASAMFQYGRNVERPICVVETISVALASDIRINEITPQQWQKELNLGKSDRIQPPRMPNGLNRAQKANWKMANREELERVRKLNDAAKRKWKRDLCDHASSRFPRLTVTMKTCDALLLLDAATKIEAEKLPL